MTKIRVAITLKLLISIGLLYYIMSAVDLQAAIDKTMGASKIWFGFCVALLLANTVSTAGRWCEIVRALGSQQSLTRSIKMHFVASFFSLFGPGALSGDAVRVIYGRLPNMTIASILNIVLLDHVITLTALVAVVLIVWPIAPAWRSAPEPSIHIIFASLGLLALSCAGGVLAILLARPLQKIPGLYKARQLMLKLCRDAVAVIRSRNLLRTIAWTLGSLTSVCFAAYAVGRGIGIQLGLFEYFVIMPLLMLVMAVPISIAGWGPREGSAIILFGFVGIDEVSALAVSVLLGIFMTVTSLPGGLVWLGLRRDKGVAGPAQ